MIYSRQCILIFENKVEIGEKKNEILMLLISNITGRNKQNATMSKVKYNFIKKLNFLNIFCCIMFDANDTHFKN